MLIALALAAQVAPDCKAFAARANEPVALRMTPVTADALAHDPGQIDGSADWQRGTPIYEGKGLTLTSDDPRIAHVTVRDGYALAGPCNHAIDAPGGWNAGDSSISPTLRFRYAPDAGSAPGSLEAQATGAVPVLSGHRAGASWPMHTRSDRFFLALMHPEDGSEGTVLVAFPARAGKLPSHVVASLALPFQGLSVVAYLHGPWVSVNLSGRSARGALHQVVLRLSDEQIASLAAAVGP